MRDRWTADDIPDQRGRLAVVTGANTGLGFETARMLAARDASVVLAVRNMDKGKQAAARIAETVPGAHVTVQRLDLTSLESIRDAAAELRATHPRIDLLINNAGVMYTPKQTTRDGFELQFGTNHLGHFALTGLLLEQMLPVPGSRVVTVSSLAHRVRTGINFADLQWERSYSRGGAYGQSKLANLMFTYELQRRLSGAGTDTGAGPGPGPGQGQGQGTGTGTTIAVAAHPGAANTELMRNLPTALRAIATVVTPLVAQSAAKGALPTLRAATDPGVSGGHYYGPDGFMQTRGYPTLVESTEQSHDEAAQRRLWSASEDLTGIAFPG
jgi:NAD(P)-dependent dehydrogenase (short-subunit alcohol dehydrogenase family)